MADTLTQEVAAARFATICALHDFGVAMKRQQFKVQNPQADDAAIHAMLLEWLGHKGRTRPPGIGLRRRIRVEKID